MCLIHEFGEAVTGDIPSFLKTESHEAEEEKAIADLLSKLPEIREQLGDRHLMRALHFIEENERVASQKAALKKGDVQSFLSGVLASGDSSFKQLQNVYTVKNGEEQGLSLALAITDGMPCGSVGASRVHGGGFAGTIQAYVRREHVDGYIRLMDSVFGEGAVMRLNVRPLGAIKVF